MPVFEFRCDSCRQKFSLLVGVVADTAPPCCPGCGCETLTKLFSRFATGRPGSDSLESLADDSDTDDPSSMSTLMKEMRDELGDDICNDFEDLIESASLDA